MWLVAAAVLIGLVLPLLVVGANGPATMILPLAVAALAVVVSAWTLQRTRSQRRLYEERLSAWAAEQATQAERLRIARDLHDLVSHGLGLITVRAAAAGRTAGPDGDTERANALADIEQVSRETTRELRRMLTVLRTRGAGSAPLRPADSLGDLPAIVQAANHAGLVATLDADDLGDVSAGTQLTVCAVVREGLNNTARHAGPTRVHVRVHRAMDEIVTSIQDAGPESRWRPQPGAGHGLKGLSERVTALGGTLHADPGDPGFQLTARIPDQEHP